MTYYSDLGTRTCVAQGERIRAIGGLNPEHSYTRGDVPSEFVDRLKAFVEHQHLSITFPWLIYCGLHECEFCEGAMGSANCAVPFEAKLYVFPAMIVHYIEEHSYHPPDEFITAVMHAPLPEKFEYDAGVTEYDAAIESMFPGLLEKRGDLELFQALGSEIGPNMCRRPGCDRKTVKLSVMCRRHHYEMIKGEPCPFSDDDYQA